VNVHVNRLGFLDDEPIEGETRILFLGDSVVESAGFPRAETFVELTEARLGGRIEIVNAAVGDSGLSEAYDVLVDSGLGQDPALVVLGVYLNDSRPPQGFADENILESPFIRALRSNVLLRKSHLANFIAFHIYERGLKEAAGAPMLSRRFGWVEAYHRKAWISDAEDLRKMVGLARWDWGAAWVPEEIEAMAEQIERFRVLLEERKIPFAVVLFPVDVQLRSLVEWEHRWAPQSALKQYLSHSKIPTLDVAEALGKAEGPGVFLDHCHLGPAGQDAAASALVEFFTDQLSL